MGLGKLEKEGHVDKVKTNSSFVIVSFIKKEIFGRFE